MARNATSATTTRRAPVSARSSRVHSAAAHVIEALEARRLLSAIPNATLYREWLDAPADFKAAVAQLEAQHPNFRRRFESDLAILAGTFMGPVLSSTVSTAAEEPALATAAATAPRHAKPRHPRPAKPPKPAPHQRKPHHPHRDAPITVSVNSAAYDWTHANHTLTFSFSANVSASLANSGALTVQDLSTGTTIPSTNITLSYNTTNNTATYSIPWGQVADGVYQATLSASIVQDGSGHHLAGDYAFTNNLFFVTGDFNHDGYNNFTDLTTVSQNYGITAATYAQGDSNYDGMVGFADLLAQSQHYHTTTNLPVPSGLNSPTQTPTTALLIWQPGTGPTAPGSAAVSGYNVYRTLNGTTTTAATNVAATAYLDTGLAQQTTYTYQLRSTDSAGDISLPSHPALSVQTPAPTNSNGGTTGGSGGTGGVGFDTTPPDAPANLTVSQGSPVDSSLVISWSAPQATDVVSYLVTRNGTPIGGVNATGELRFTDSGLAANTTYSYGVIAFDGTANQSSPATVSGTTSADATPPSNVLDLTVVSQSANAVSLSWRAATDNVGVVSYTVTRGYDLQQFSVPASSSLTYNWTDSSPPSSYWNVDIYAVAAVDAAGNQSPGVYVNTKLDYGQFWGDVISDSNNQYIPQTYQDYFYNDIIKAFRDLLTPQDPWFPPDPYPGSIFTPLPQAHWYDPSYDTLFVDQQQASLYEASDQSGFYPSNHNNESGWELQVNPWRMEDQHNPVYWDPASGAVWLDSNNDGVYQASETRLYDPDNALKPGAAGRTNGISSYSDNGHMLFWFDSGYSSYSSYDSFRRDFADLYYDIDKLASYYPHPYVGADENGNLITKDTIGELLGSTADSGVGTISIDQGSSSATITGGDLSQFRPGDSIEIDNSWYLVDFFASTGLSPDQTTIPLAEPYTGSEAIQGQSFSIRNWTLFPDEQQQAGSYFPDVQYTRGEPTPASIVFPQQFSELASVLSDLGEAPPQSLSDATGNAPLPLTSEMDYMNVVPDTNLDGIVQVPQEWGSPASGTGFVSLQPDRSAPQVVLPLDVNRQGALPVHAYISQGGFASANTQPQLLTNPPYSNGSSNDYYSEAWRDSLQSGAPFAYSLDTALEANLGRTRGVNS